MIRVRGLFQKDLKNRSSKHLICLTKMKPALWSMSNEELHLHSKECTSTRNIYEDELNRRAMNATKRKTPRPKSKKD